MVLRGCSRSSWAVQQAFPTPKIQIPEVPRPPEQTFTLTAAQVKSGEATRRFPQLHGLPLAEIRRLRGVGLLNGGVPDLRYMPPEAHRDWYAIVLGGSHRQQGMMSFGVPSKVPAMSALSAAEADDIHAYVIDRACGAAHRQQHGLVD